MITVQRKSKSNKNAHALRTILLFVIVPVLALLIPAGNANAAAANSQISITKLPVLGVNELESSDFLFKTGLNKQQSTVQFQETGQSVPFRLKAAIQTNESGIDPRNRGYSVYWEDDESQSPITLSQGSSSIVLQSDTPSATDEGVLSLIKNNRANSMQKTTDSVDVLVLTFIIE